MNATIEHEDRTTIGPGIGVCLLAVGTSGLASAQTTPKAEVSGGYQLIDREGVCPGWRGLSAHPRRRWSERLSVYGWCDRPVHELEAISYWLLPNR
jgi:hypothetical protein